MVSQDDFPDVWSCSSNNKRVGVEVRVPTDREIAFDGIFPSENTDYAWIEIPTTSVEQWIEKGDAADIQRTAKVKFPSEWGDNSATVKHNSPRKLIEGFSPTTNQPYMLGRIVWQAKDGTRIIGHLGWIGGVGPASDEGMSKMWIYDFAELLSGVPIGATFVETTIKEAMDIITNITNSNTPIPIANSIIVPPNTEKEFAKSVPLFTTVGEGDIGVKVPIMDTPIQLELDGEESINSSDVGSAYYSFVEAGLTSPRALDDDTFSAVARDDQHSFETKIIADTGSLITGNFGTSFATNRHTLQDVYDWFETKTDTSLFFTPQADAVTLVADVVPERRIFAQQDVIEFIDEKFSDIRETVSDITGGELVDKLPFDFDGLNTGDAYRPHQNVRILKNNALYEMKPVNTVHLRGTSPYSFGVSENTGNLWSYSGYTSITYPSVKVVHPALLEAADGYELAPEVIESDAETLDEGEFEARKALREKLSEPSEGEIIMNGTPRILPYDRLDAFETCNEDIKYEQIPVQYEVESVKHQKKSNGAFKTSLRVSIWANDRTIEIKKSTMVTTRQ